MPNHRALSPEQAKRAAELYADGKSRLQVAAILRTSESAVKTALKHEGVQMRDPWVASAATSKKKTGYRRKSQLARYSSVFALATRIH